MNNPSRAYEATVSSRPIVLMPMARRAGLRRRKNRTKNNPAANAVLRDALKFSAWSVDRADDSLERGTKMRQWFASRQTWQKVVVVVFLWPLMAAWWLWTNPRFTTKTKAIVTAVSIPALAVMAALGSTSEKTDVVAAGKVKATTSTSTTTSSGFTVSAGCRAMADELDEIDSLIRLYIDQIHDATNGVIQNESKAGAARVKKDNMAPQRDAKIAALTAGNCNYHKGFEETTGTFSPPTTPTGEIDVAMSCDDLYEKFSKAASNRDAAFQSRDYVLRDQYQAEAVRFGREMSARNCQ